MESCINFTRIWLFFVEVWDEIAPSFLDGNLGDTATNALRGNGSARVCREWLRISFSSSWVVYHSNCAAAPTHAKLNGLFSGYHCSKIIWEIGPSFFDAKYNLTWGGSISADLRRTVAYWDCAEGFDFTGIHFLVLQCICNIWKTRLYYLNQSILRNLIYWCFFADNFLAALPTRYDKTLLSHWKRPLLHIRGLNIFTSFNNLQHQSSQEVSGHRTGSESLHFTHSV